MTFHSWPSFDVSVYEPDGGPLMKGKTHKTEEMIRILRQADGGEAAQAICREHNISEQTFYRWKKKYAGLGVAELRRLKQLEDENKKLKQR